MPFLNDAAGVLQITSESDGDLRLLIRCLIPEAEYGHEIEVSLFDGLRRLSGVSSGTFGSSSETGRSSISRIHGLDGVHLLTADHRFDSEVFRNTTHLRVRISIAKGFSTEDGDSHSIYLIETAKANNVSLPLIQMRYGQDWETSPSEFASSNGSSNGVS